MSEEEKKGEAVKGDEEEEGEFEALAEWTIRRLRAPESSSEGNYAEKAKRWVLYSLGLDKLSQDIFLYLQRAGSTTTTEIAKEFDMSPNTARKYLDDLHTIGFVDYMGREYHLTYESLSRAIELTLMPRITDTLRMIAGIASSTEGRPRPSPGAIRHKPPIPPPASVPAPWDALEDRPVPMPDVSVSTWGVEDTSYYSSMTIDRQILESWQKEDKKVRIHCYGSLAIESDVDAELFNSVIESVECYGPVRVPVDVYGGISHKFKSIGSLQTY
jgi:hypothetical protein